MAAVVGDWKRVLMVEFMQLGTTVTSEVYCETLKELSRTIQKRRHGMLTSGVVLFRENRRPHTAARTRALLGHFSWELFDRPSYSPGLAPSDYHLFTYLENWLRSQSFNNDEELLEGAKTRPSLQEANFLDTGRKKNFLPVKTHAAVTTLRSSLSLYVFFCMTIFLSLLVLLKSLTGCCFP
jgi:histone-lysine N-methyltransferase SETMAR